MNVLDLFSGIGGFSVGLERAGMRTVAFCEVNGYCRSILRHRFPGIPIYSDVRNLTADRLRTDGIVPDVICGGFPCQDVSLAGAGAGIEGGRSGLWFEFARLIEEVAPQWAVIENVSALRHRGMGDVLRTLAALRYDAEWHCIPASAIGAHHRRDRVWVVAHAQHGGCQGRNAQRARAEAALPYRQAIADADNAGRIEQWRPLPIAEEVAWSKQRGWWDAEPGMGRVANGVSARVDRLTALGNAVVPQLPELIGRAIMSVQQSA